MTRRSLFAALLAPLAAKFARNPGPTPKGKRLLTIHEMDQVIWDSYMRASRELLHVTTIYDPQLGKQSAADVSTVSTKPHVWPPD